MKSKSGDEQAKLTIADFLEFYRHFKEQSFLRQDAFLHSRQLELRNELRPEVKRAIEASKRNSEKTIKEMIETFSKNEALGDFFIENLKGDVRELISLISAIEAAMANAMCDRLIDKIIPPLDLE